MDNIEKNVGDVPLPWLVQAKSFHNQEDHATEHHEGVEHPSAGRLPSGKVASRQVRAAFRYMAQLLLDRIA